MRRTWPWPKAKKPRRKDIFAVRSNRPKDLQMTDTQFLRRKKAKKRKKELTYPATLSFKRRKK